MSECTIITVEDSLRRRIAELEAIIRNMKHVDCRGEGGFYFIEHRDWLKALEGNTP